MDWLTMSWLEAVILGLVQGLTEFLPVSSTGHVRLVPLLFGWDDPGASFTAVTQLGTMAAVLVFFWRDLVRIGKAWVSSLIRPQQRNSDAIMGWFMIVGTLPIGILGFVFADGIRTVLRDLRVIGTALIVLGILLWLVDKYAPRTRTSDSVGIKDVVLVGFAQAAALIPGVSRSGATITMGRLLGLERASAARFSFLLSVPAVVASGLFEATSIDGTEWGPTLVATAVAFVVGWASIAWLLRWLGEHSMAVFGAYRVIVGVMVFVALGMGWVSAV